ncbi:MAG: 2-oxo-4-hydroxy-4-carboxy-5-ureidoimidazoline decarboxylase [Pelomonas sp.]|nr:2-oxo-4-hydroxy-4-carboxy-5-ureidoimidazoline decarboxylase [Roseateles sp.]
MTLTLDSLNRADAAEFARLLDGVYEHTPWVAARAVRPAEGFASLAALKIALVRAVDAASPDEQLALIRAHPELAGKAMVAGALTAESSGEQARAGLTHCTPEEFARLQQLNRDYAARFGWPFILAVRGPRGAGLTRAEIIEAFARRLAAHPDDERAECLRQIHRIAEVRLGERCGAVPALGRQLLEWADALAAHSDPGFAEQGLLAVTYLTPAHRACAAQLSAWMTECGFDEVGIDAVGNVVAHYHGLHRDAPAWLVGSHYDTVRKAGRLDGRLGVFAAMLAVRELHVAGRRLDAGVELVAFAEEEGQRFAATFLGSSALTGGFDAAWLAQRDADGITMREAMRAAGLPGELAAIAALARDPARYRGFVEVHIEQGPVLARAGLPLGVVTSINGSRRLRGEFTGEASHAGTTPMSARRDAAAGAAELALAVERLAAAQPGVVGTVGQLEVPGGSINVVPGCCRFSLDLRAPDDAARDALADAVLAEAAAIAARRGLRLSVDEVMRASAAPSDAALQDRWEAAVQRLGLPLLRLPSGAGHDAMKLHERLPQAMLFVRGENLGISHNPLESSSDDDCELAVRALLNLLDP